MGIQLTSTAKLVPSDPDHRLKVYAIGGAVTWTDTAGNTGTIANGGSKEIIRPHFFSSTTSAALEIVEVDESRVDYTFSVRDYGALGDGVADDASAINAGILDADAAGGGDIYLPSGTYLCGSPLTMYANVTLRGAGRGATTIKLKSSTNDDLIRTSGFSSLTGGSSRGTVQYFGLRDLTLDGNKAGNTSGWCLRLFGHSYRLSSITIKNGASGNWYSESGTGGFDMECKIEDVKCYSSANGTNGIEWRGPNDSQFLNMVVARGSGESGGKGILTAGNAAGEQFHNCHVFGPFTNNWELGNTAYLTNCVGEGATGVNCLILAHYSSVHGRFFGTLSVASATEKGIQLGDSGASKSPKSCRIDALVDNFSGSGTPFDFSSSGGNNHVFVVHQDNGSTSYTGNPNTGDLVFLSSNKTGGAYAKYFVAQIVDFRDRWQLAGTAPTVAPGAQCDSAAAGSAGLGASGGSVTATTKNPAVAGAIATLTWAAAAPATPKAVIVTPQNTAAMTAQLYASAKSTTAVTISANANPGNAQVLNFDVLVVL